MKIRILEKIPKKFEFKESLLIHSEVLQALGEIPDSTFDLVFADPPYFLSNDGFSVKSGKSVSVNKGDWDKSQGFENEIDFHESWIRECLRVLKPNGSIVISGTYHSIYKCGFLLQKLGCRIVNDISWFKPNGAPALAGRNFTASHETLIWASKGPKAKHTFNYLVSKSWEVENDSIYRTGKQMRSVWSIPSTPKREKSHGVHPTQKPFELLRRVVAICSKEGDLVLDPFCGSGTTGVASCLLNRRFVGIDLEKEFLELSAKRMRSADEDYAKYL
ncbi:MAG: site-specific DNA-methyltransferase [Bacteroidetes bacterium]|nr:site-specific DNA-methyltransferase [bacterium]NBP66294.1 site-specific DNA-methyltransferase [Bacteroidota bacterium]